MIKLRSYNFFKQVVVLFLITYLFCALTNIFILPRTVGIIAKAPAVSGVSLQKTALRTANNTKSLIRIIDRSVVNETQIDCRALCFIVLFACSSFILLSVNLKLNTPLSYLFHNKQYSYLAFRTLRI